jgi:hypothetical protein
MELHRFINFEELITPTVITIVYILGVILIVLGSLVIMALSFFPASSSVYSRTAPSFDGMTMVLGLLYLVFGNIFWRLLCEFIVVVFKINDHISSVDSYFIEMKQRI